jgi:hypothetical protein
MFLRNYYNILALRAVRNFEGITPTTAFPDVYGSFGAGKLSIKRWNETVENAIYNSYTYAIPYLKPSYLGFNSVSSPTDSGSTAIVFGTGDTPVTMDDYKLDNVITSSIIQRASISAGNLNYTALTYDPTTDTFTLRIRVVITNSSASPVIINEYGLVTYYYLFYREVLATPVVIPAGDSVFFECDIKFKVPEV